VLIVSPPFPSPKPKNRVEKAKVEPPHALSRSRVALKSQLVIRRFQTQVEQRKTEQEGEDMGRIERVEDKGRIERGGKGKEE
jgi:hypothetical protein